MNNANCVQIGHMWTFAGGTTSVAEGTACDCGMVKYKSPEPLYTKRQVLDMIGEDKIFDSTGYDGEEVKAHNAAKQEIRDKLK